MDKSVIIKAIIVFLAVGVFVYLANYRFGFNPDNSTTFTPYDQPISTPSSSIISATQESSSPSPTSSAILTHSVKVYLIALNDNGKVGPKVGLRIL